MRKIFLFGLSVFLILSFIHNAEAANLLTDGGFETGNLSSWGWGWWPSESGPPMCTMTAKRSGTYGLWLYTAGGGSTLEAYSFVHQEISASAGEIFTGSAYIRTPAGQDWVDGSYACVRISFLSSGDSVIASYDSTHLVAGNTPYGSLYTVTTPQAPSGTAYVQFMCYLYEPSGDAGQDVANFDDCSLIKETAPEAVLSVNPPVLGFGNDLASLTFDIENTGSGTLTWSITDDSGWITIIPTSGTTTTEKDTITVTIDRTGLTNLTYSGIISVTSDGGDKDVEAFMETLPGSPIPAQASIVTTDGYRLMVQKRLPDGSLDVERPYIIKGAAWAPASIGTTSEYFSRRNVFGDWYRLDIQLLREMNGNTVYIFLDFGTDSSMIDTAMDILDYCYRNDVMVIVTADEDGSDNTTNITQVVNAYKNHPAVLMWALGNEWNLWRPDRPKYYHRYDTLAAAAVAMQANALQVKSLDTNHPVSSILGEINYPTQNDVNNIISNVCTAVDVWGANIYRGPEFYALFTEWAGMSAKPLFLSEFGTDAFHTTSWWPPVGSEDEAMQADFIDTLWVDLAQELSFYDPLKVCLGGTVFEWNDEWWKSSTGDASVHEPDGYETTWNPIAHPDGFANEEWFGIVSIKRERREAYATLQSHFSSTSNSAPVVSDIPDQTIAEGGSFIQINLDDYVTDVDNTDSEITWTYSGETELSVDITARVATITTPGPEWSGDETITFRATDPGTLYDEDSASFAVGVVNDAPVVSNIPDQTINEGESFTQINLDDYVTDVDNADSEITWTYSGNTELSVDITARVATITAPGPEWSGDETITFRATDPGTLYDEDSASFTVGAINDAPVVGDIPGQTINEGESFTQINLDDYVTDVDNADSEITWTYSGNTELSVDITARVATITAPGPEWSGDETITFRATDPGTLYDEDSAVFTVNPGGTPSITVRAASGGPAEFYLEGVRFYSRSGGGGGGRGINIAIIHEITGELEDIRHFDTWWPYGGDKSHIQAAIFDYVNNIVEGRIVMTAMTDYNYFNTDVIDIFETVLGSQYAGIAVGRDSWAMITKKGNAVSIAEEWHDKPFGEPIVIADVEAVIPLSSTTDIQPPAGTFLINGGEAKVFSNRVTLDLSGITDSESGLIPGGKMRLSNDNVNWSEDADFQVSKVWYLERGTGPKTVYAEVRDRDSNWSETITAQIALYETAQIQDVTDSDSYAIELCSDGQGNTYVAYERDSAVYAKYSRDGGRLWSEEIRLSDNNDFSSNLEITCDNSGHVYAVWKEKEYGSFQYNVFFNTSPDFGVTWLANDIKINDTPPGKWVGYISLCADNNGNVYTSWIDNRNAISYYYRDCYMNISHDYGQTWLADDFRINQTEQDVYSSVPIHTACNDQGEVYVLWVNSERYVSTNFSHDAGVAWQANDVRISAEPSYAYSYLNIALDGSDCIFVSWIGYCGVLFDVSSDHGATWLVEDMPITSSLKLNTMRSLEMEADQNGNIYLLWRDDRDSLTYPGNTSLYYNHSGDRGATWLADDVRINTNTYTVTGSLNHLASVGNAELSVNGNGLVAVLWKDYRSEYQGEAEDTDIFMNYSVDYGLSWLTEDIEMTTAYPAHKSSIPAIQCTNDNRICAVWKERRGYLDNVIVSDSRAAYAKTITVAPGESIQDAVDIAAEGDTIYIIGGTYEEDVLIDSADNLTLIGEDVTVTFIEGNIVLIGTDATIVDITVVYDEGEYMSYTNDHYDNFDLLTDAGITAVDSEITVMNCIIYPNSYTPLEPPGGMGALGAVGPFGKGIQILNLYGSDAKAPMIDNILIVHCDTGIYYYSQAFSGDVTGTIQNSTLDANKYGIVLRMHNENPLIQNNIISNSLDSIHITYEDDSLLTDRLDNITNNCIFIQDPDGATVWCDATQSEQIPTGAGNIYEDPQYTAPWYLDYYPENLDCADMGYREP